MAAHPIPVSTPNHILIGADDVAWFEQLKSTGEAQDVPDTPVLRSVIIEKFLNDWKEDAAADEPVKVKTPVVGREYEALAAISVDAGSSDGPPDLEIVITVLESSGLHITLPRSLKGRYFALVYALGTRGSFYSDQAAFVKYVGAAVSQSFEAGKQVSWDLRFKVLNNTEDVVCTIPGDWNGQAAAITIPAGEGLIVVDTPV